MMLDPGWTSAAASLIAVGAVIFKDLFKLGRRSQEFLTRSEHERICEQRQKDIQEKLGYIREDINEIKENHQQATDEARKFRHDLANRLLTIELDAAVAKERERQRQAGGR